MPEEERRDGPDTLELGGALSFLNEEQSADYSVLPDVLVSVAVFCNLKTNKQPPPTTFKEKGVFAT